MRSVALTFDFDGISPWIGSLGGGVGSRSRGEFGRVGVGRILALLECHGIRATFFVPGHTALAFPDAVRAIAAAGHEIGHHGFVHEDVTTLSPEQERAVLERGIEILGETTGTRPVGYRSPSWELTESTMALLAGHGFLYDSSLMGSDFAPYWPRTGDEAPADGPFVFGPPVPVVEMPVSWMLDDFPHFEYLRGGRGPNTMKPPSQVHEIWWREFEFFAEETDGGCFTLTMHPEVIGRGSRLRMLDELLAAMVATGAATFEPLGDAARRWRDAQPTRPELERTDA
jgi:peptidoglycan/xylan/chitin deacetylase (PgdA/CDA1 family)